MSHPSLATAAQQSKVLSVTNISASESPWSSSRKQLGGTGNGAPAWPGQEGRRDSAHWRGLGGASAEQHSAAKAPCQRKTNGKDGSQVKG